MICCNGLRCTIGWLYLRKQVMTHQAHNYNKQTWIQVYPILRLKCWKVTLLCPNGCVLSLVIYSCSPRNRPFQIRSLNAALLNSTWPLETVNENENYSDERFKVTQHILYCSHTIVFGTIILLRNYCFFQLDFIFIH